MSYLNEARQPQETDPLLVCGRKQGMRTWCAGQLDPGLGKSSPSALPCPLRLSSRGALPTPLPTTACHPPERACPQAKGVIHVHHALSSTAAGTLLIPSQPCLTNGANIGNNRFHAPNDVTFKHVDTAMETLFGVMIFF